MKVYVAIGSWNYEGYAKPIGIYSTVELAREAISKSYDGYDDRDILEYELDVICEWPKEQIPIPIKLSE